MNENNKKKSFLKKSFEKRSEILGKTTVNFTESDQMCLLNISKVYRSLRILGKDELSRIIDLNISFHLNKQFPEFGIRSLGLIKTEIKINNFLNFIWNL